MEAKKGRKISVENGYYSEAESINFNKSPYSKMNKGKRREVKVLKMVLTYFNLGCTIAKVLIFMKSMDMCLF